MSCHSQRYKRCHLTVNNSLLSLHTMNVYDFTVSLTALITITLHFEHSQTAVVCHRHNFSAFFLACANCEIIINKKIFVVFIVTTKCLCNKLWMIA